MTRQAISYPQVIQDDTTAGATTPAVDDYSSAQMQGDEPLSRIGPAIRIVGAIGVMCLVLGGAGVVAARQYRRYQMLSCEHEDEQFLSATDGLHDHL